MFGLRTNTVSERPGLTRRQRRDTPLPKPDALSDHQRLIRQFGAPELFLMYQFDENVINKNDREWFSNSS